MPIHAAWILTAILLYPFLQQRRLALLISALICAVWIVVSTEILSLFHAFSYGPLLTWWLLTILGLLAANLRRRPALKPWITFNSRPGLINILLACTVALLLASIFASARLSPPNNADALGYHLPRQVQWIQRRTVWHFPAENNFQLMMPPFAEYVGAQFMILSGRDRWSNVIQFEAGVLVLLAISLAIQIAGGSPRAQWISALLVVANPSFYLMASSPKNDIVAGAWICMLLVFVLLMLRDRRCNWLDAVWVGSALGLLALTKGTGPFIAAPVAIALAVTVAWLLRLRAWQWFSVAGAISILIVAPHFIRNQQTFGHPSGDAAAVAIHNNQSHSPADIISVLVRNISMHLATPSDSFNARVLAAVEWIHRGLGYNMSDPNTTFVSIPFRVRFAPNEDCTNATALCVLALILPALVLLVRKRLTNPLFWLLLAIPYLSALVFSIVFKWQETGTRLQIPIFCLFAAPMAIVLATRPLRFVSIPILIVVALNLIPATSENPRPIFGDCSVFTIDPNFLLAGFSHVELEGAGRTVSFLKNNNIHIIGLAYHDFQYRVERGALRELNHPVFTIMSPTYLRDRWQMDGIPEVVLMRNSKVTTYTDPLNGKTYLLVAQIYPYSILIREDLRENVHARPSLFFAGWDTLEGAGPLEGPYKPLPVMYWGFGPETRVNFKSQGGPSILQIKVGRSDGAPQQITGFINDAKLFEFKILPGGKFTQITSPFTAHPGKNQIKFTYTDWDKTDPAWPRTLAFLEIGIFPAAHAPLFPTSQPVIPYNTDP